MKADDKDVIVYKKGLAFSTKKADVEMGSALSAHYAGRHDKSELEKLVVNPKEVLREIEAKLTPLEKYVLHNLVKV